MNMIMNMKRRGREKEKKGSKIRSKTQQTLTTSEIPVVDNN
jgi:hypothetical protein